MPMVGFKYAFVYKKIVFELKIIKGHVFVFDIWSVLEKYLQIQSNTHTDYQQKVKHCLT